MLGLRLFRRVFAISCRLSLGLRVQSMRIASESESLRLKAA